MELAASKLQCDASTQASTAKWKSSRGVPRSDGLALYRRFYEEGFSEKQVVYTHLHVDLLLILPQPLMIRFRQEILAMEKDKNMPYLDSISRMCREEGVQEGSLAQARESVIEVLEIRFGEISTELHERINALDNLRTLKAQPRRAITVPSLDQF
jgi:hypothetical protein